MTTTTPTPSKDISSNRTIQQNKMTKEELKNLTLTQRVKMLKLDLKRGFYKKFGHVTKTYNGNHQVQVLFDGEKKPRVVGYTRIELVDMEETNNLRQNPPLSKGAVSGSLLSGKTILDACCGSRMFWFDKNNPSVLFADIRNESHILCDGRELNIKPDLQMDFRNMPFDDNTFKLVIFDPPHLKHLGQGSWMGKKYGILNKTWKEDLKMGFDECMRVLEPHGTLIFKWNEDQIKVSEILNAIGQQPLIGHKSGKSAKTHWLTFMKGVGCNRA